MVGTYRQSTPIEHLSAVAVVNKGSVQLLRCAVHKLSKTAVTWTTLMGGRGRSGGGGGVFFTATN